MKMKDKERIIFTPGLDSRSLKMDYHDVDNMVIVGNTGSGKTTALNAIVKSMIESNSSEYLQLVMFDGSNDVNESPFFTTTRITPYTELQRYLGTSPKMFYHDIFSILHGLHWVASSVDGDLGEIPAFGTIGPKLIPGKIVVVINEFEALPMYLQYLVRLIIKRNSPQVKFILTGQSERPFKEFIKDIRYRLTTRVDNSTSDFLFGCNIGSKRADKYGTCWFYDVTEPDVYTKHIVNYIHDSLLNRMMKTYSSGKVSNPKLLLKFRRMIPSENRYDCANNAIRDIYGVDVEALLDEFNKIATTELKGY